MHVRKSETNVLSLQAHNELAHTDETIIFVDIILRFGEHASV